MDLCVELSERNSFGVVELRMFGIVCRKSVWTELSELVLLYGVGADMRNVAFACAVLWCSIPSDDGE